MVSDDSPDRVQTLLRQRSDDAIQPIAGVAKSRHDIAVLVEPLVDRTRHKRDRRRDVGELLPA